MMAVRAVGGLRLAAMLIGGLGALVGLGKGLLWFGGWLLVGLVAGGFGSGYLELVLGTEGATAISSALGLAGAGLAAASKRVAGASLMLVGAVGVAASAAAHALLLAVVMAPVANFEGRPVEEYYPSILYYAVWLIPVPLLLVAAALAFFARRVE